MPESLFVSFKKDGARTCDIDTGSFTSYYEGCTGKSFEFLDNLVGWPSENPDKFFITAERTKPFLCVFQLYFSEQPIKTLATPEILSCFTLSPCRNFCVAGTHSGTIYIWSLRGGELIRTWQAHYSRVNELRLVGEGDYLITAGDDSLVNCYAAIELLKVNSSRTPRPLHQWRFHHLRISGIAVASLGHSRTFIFTSSEDKQLFCWRPGASNNLPLFSCHIPSPVLHMSYSAINSELYLSCSDMIIHIVHVEFNEEGIKAQYLPGDTEFSQFVGHQRPIHGSCVSADARTLFSLGGDGIRVWDTATRQLVKHFTIPGELEPSGIFLFNDASQNSRSRMSKDLLGNQTRKDIYPFGHVQKACSQRPVQVFISKQSPLVELMHDYHSALLSRRFNSSDTLADKWVTFRGVSRSDQAASNLHQTQQNNKEFTNLMVTLLESLFKEAPVNQASETRQIFPGQKQDLRASRTRKTDVIIDRNQTGLQKESMDSCNNSVRIRISPAGLEETEQDMSSTTSNSELDRSQRAKEVLGEAEESCDVEKKVKRGKAAFNESLDATQIIGKRASPSVKEGSSTQNSSKQVYLSGKAMLFRRLRKKSHGIKKSYLNSKETPRRNPKIINFNSRKYVRLFRLALELSDTGKKL